jgi:hypothetical protein
MELKSSKSIITLLILLGITFIPSIGSAESLQEKEWVFETPEEIRVGFGIHTTGVSWVLKINDIEVATDGDFEQRKSDPSEHGLQGLQLFHKNHPVKDKMAPQYKKNLCLNEGKNKLYISFKLKNKNEFPQPQKGYMYMNSLTYDKYIFEFKTPKLTFGVIEEEFYVYRKMPENYETKIFEVKK